MKAYRYKIYRGPAGPSAYAYASNGDELDRMITSEISHQADAEFPSRPGTFVILVELIPEERPK